MSSKNKTILISGASIAGPSLAYWLKRYGFQPTIVEQAPDIRKGGYPIDVRGEAAEVAKRMGIWPRIQQKNTGTKDLTFVNSANQAVGTIHVGALGEALGLEDQWVEIMREDLGNVLYDITKDEVEYIFGDSIQALVQNDEGVEVTFKSGNTRKFDLVIGADGLHSKVRNLMFGDEEHFTRYCGYYIAVFAIDNYINLNYEVKSYNVPGKAVLLRSAKANTEALAMFLFKQPEKLHYDHRNLEQQKQLIVDALAGEGWETARLLEKMQSASDFYFDEISQIRMECWSQARVALLGDAGYCASPLTGQGTMLAMIGAYILAGELKAADGDYRTAFRAYEEAYRPHVEQTQQQVDRLGKTLVPGSKFEIWALNQSGHLINMITKTGWLWKRFPAKPAIMLKDYGEAASKVLASNQGNRQDS